ncbi:alternative ribosome rescue aminoacyl-tRNA hydrolase ArfB [Leucobacter sp. M11]|uniref:alternative ribosome rescue aminoacyl-tRNA hydrolase ArfB n=1 Tax=Leucobacter sp. M11 TaxID=2993565 RepID=UPI002D80D5E3|nr:alternative ribosome rescue aminoacyl-tRNA hydrolase ArfB [Leucobacter sp. M11]MEB4615984.1 alternative ribosome rescue aminoacyl-tRNA hydrolase ArfB [Leucobacter sp. M11]
MDLEVSRRLTIPAAELGWRFSRSSGPGGQHVNTSDSRVELSWNLAESLAVTPEQRARLFERLGHRLVGDAITVSASEQRSQLRNRETALEKLREILAAALAPDGPKRRATKPTRGSKQRRLAAKGQRSEVKRNRQRPGSFD